ncbi:hypothetical protein YC2023_073014 [Brassica napus]
MPSLSTSSSSSSSMLEKQEPESSMVIEKFGCDRIDESLICVRGENKVTRTLGSREFMRYYKQKPPPSSQKHIVNSLATRTLKVLVLSFLKSGLYLLQVLVFGDKGSRQFDLANREAMEESAERRRMFDCEAEKLRKLLSVTQSWHWKMQHCSVR